MHFNPQCILFYCGSKATNMLFEVFDKFLNPKLLLLGEGSKSSLFTYSSGLGVHRVGDFKFKSRAGGEHGLQGHDVSGSDRFQVT